MLLFRFCVSISVSNSGNPYTIQENNSTIWESTSTYEPSCSLKDFPSSILFPPTFHEDHVSVGTTRWFSLELHLTAPETYYTVYTRYKEYSFKHNQGFELRPNEFLVFLQRYIRARRTDGTQMFNIILK